tara:strand:+ start:184 stop:624 length:441 start_codon:yes stop_codon:yes gene_type:complete
MNKKTILMERLDKYCKQLGVEHPKIYWTKKEVREKYSGENLGKRLLGKCSRGAGWIIIVYNKHDGLRQLDDTLRHELVHWRFPQVNHGVRFEKLMKQLKDGICWEPFTNADYEAYWKKRVYSYNKKHGIVKEDTLIYTERGSNNNV